MAIKNLQPDFTTPEQSKLLLELGVPADSADCYYNLLDKGQDKIPHWRNEEELNDKTLFLYSFIKPCWSVGRLIRIIKICSDVPIDWTGGLNEERDILEVVDSTLYALCLGKHMDFLKLEK